MLTEDEAKKRWCPFARIVGATPRSDGSCDVASGQAAFNRTSQVPRTVSYPDAAMCIGSQCMAWRDDVLGNAGRAQAWAARAQCKTPDEAPPPPVREGFCGLAGRPA